MKILYSPQRSNDDILTYIFEGEKITVTHRKQQSVAVEQDTKEETAEQEEIQLQYELQVVDEHTDTFDFSEMPDGEALVTDIETSLPINPIISAKRENGELKVELLYYHGENATHEELFPEWKVIDNGKN